MLHAEFELLAAASSADPALALARLAQSPTAIDAGILTQLIRRHRLAPLVTQALLPYLTADAAKSELLGLERHAIERTLRHTAVTARMASLLAARGVPALGLKGALLSERLYGCHTRRDVRDCDLLVRPERLMEADRAALEAGFERTWPRAMPCPGTKAYEALLAQAHHFEYASAPGSHNGEALEIHWRLADWDPRAMDRLWQASAPRECWPGVILHAICDDEVLLLLLCDHGAHHKWFALKWLADVAALLASRTDWDAASIAAKARELDLERPLAQALRLLERVYRFEIPPALRAAAVDCEPRAAWLADEALRTLAEPDAAAHFAEARSWRNWFRLRRYRRLLRARGRAEVFGLRSLESPGGPLGAALRFRRLIFG